MTVKEHSAQFRDKYRTLFSAVFATPVALCDHVIRISLSGVPVCLREAHLFRYIDTL